MTKLILSLAVAAALAATAALPVVAQNPKTTVQIPKETFYAGQQKGQYLAKQKLLGQKVVNKDGQPIGDIFDLIIGENNQVDGVIVQIPGTLGAAPKNIGVHLKALKFDAKDGKTVISLPAGTREVLAEIGAYKRTEPSKK